MKRLYLILFGVVITLSCMSQNIGEALYIYRNDGQFNAFFRDEVMSIEYSYEDAEGNTYDEIVTQVVNTGDSVYLIPLAVIDSISFVQPETILQPNVVKIGKKGIGEYLVSVDGMSLLFKNSVPNELQPKTGDVLISTDFNSPLLPDGFVGKVLATKMQNDVFRVDCDSIYDIFDIFEQLISIEKIEDRRESARLLEGGELSSNRNPLNFDLGFSYPLSSGEISLSGSVSGTYIATVAYNITRKEQYLNLRIDHDWQYGINLAFKSEKSFGTLKGTVSSLPAIRFPAVAPVFKFQIAGVPFIKGEGEMKLDFSLNSPVHSYVAQATYCNGHFSGWNNKRLVSDNNKLNFEKSISLNGSLQAGYMVDFWLGLDIGIKGFAKNLLKLGSGLDFYVGPKMAGDFSIKAGKENPVNFYSAFKDSKVGLSLMTVDYEFFGEATIAGHKFPKTMFCNGSMQTPLYHEWYVLPDFSKLDITVDSEQKKATVSTKPSRDILFPLKVGLGLYDSEDELISRKYESKKYKNGNEGFELKMDFSLLEHGKKYVVKPFVQIPGADIPALPVGEFELEKRNLCPDANHPHWIDLGLPSGTKWRCCNEGATLPEDYGNYYEFGKVSNAPTLEQFKEFINCTTSESKKLNDVYGRLFTGRNGASIFIPAAGYLNNGSPTGVGALGFLWSSDYNESSPKYGYRLFFDTRGLVNMDTLDVNCSEIPVRPVR